MGKITGRPNGRPRSTAELDALTDDWQPTREIAQKVGKSVQAVQALLNRAKRRGDPVEARQGTYGGWRLKREQA